MTGFFALDGYFDRRAREEFLLLLAGAFLVWLTNSMQALLVVVFKAGGLPVPQIGILLAVFGVPVVIVTLLTGAVTARLGVLGTMRIGMALTGAAFLSMHWTAASFWPALVSRLLWGVGWGLVFSPIFTYAQSRLDASGFVYRFGIFSTLAALPQAVGPPSAEWLLAQGGRDLFFILGPVPVLLALVLTVRMRPLSKPATAKGLALGPAFTGDRPLAVASIFVSGSMFGYLTSWMAATLQAKAVPIGWFFITSTAAMVGSRVIALRGVEGRDPRKVVAFGLMMMAAGHGTVALSGSVPPVAAGGLAFGLGYSVVYPVLSAWVSRGLAPAERAGPQAVFNTAFLIGLLWMPLPVTGIVSAFGYDAALLSLAGLGAAMAILLARLGFARS